MKKLLLSFALLFSFSSFAMTYEQFLKQNKEVRKYEKVFDLSFNKQLTAKDIEKLGMYIESKDEQKALEFYKARKLRNEFLSIPVSDITFLAHNKLLQSVIVEFSQESNLKKIISETTKKMGKPLLMNQNNEHFTYVWGISYLNEKNEKKIIRPLVINFDIYEQMGVVIWTAPQVDFPLN